MPNDFSASIDMFMCFSPLHSVNMVYYTDQFLYVESSLHFRNISSFFKCAIEFSLLVLRIFATVFIRDIGL